MDQVTVPVFKPLIGQRELDLANASLLRGWLGMGADVRLFEDALLKYLETEDRYVVAVSTGHAALHLGLLLAGVGNGDEVITPAFNNVADFQAILATGGTPVFCDIDAESLCIDPSRIEELISEKTKAIIVMDYDCVLCDHERIQSIAEKYGLRVIHDAAHSFGSRYRGKKIGSFSDICMFSFDPVKTMTCIDGGALVVRSKEEVARLHEMRLIGMTQPAALMYQNQRAWTYDVARLGFRYHMANLHAAIGLAQLEKIESISRSRQLACRHYSRRLASVPEVTVPVTSFEDITPFLYYIRVPELARDELRQFLSGRGIDTGIHWQPGHWFKLFHDCRRGPLPVTDRVAREILSLPLHSMMEPAVVDAVVDGIEDFFRAR